MINIPKHFHQIWLGTNPIPERFKKFKNSWIEKHPCWDITVWNESNITRLKYYDSRLIKKLKNYAEISDYLRCIILLEHGWVYIDTDFECLKNIENILENIDFFLWYEQDGTINTAIIWSTPDHILLVSLVNNFPKRISDMFNKWKYCANEKLWPIYVENFIYEHKYNLQIKIFPAMYFYPIHHKYFSEWKMHFKNPQLWESYAIHHYAGHWISPWKKLRKKIYNIHPYISTSYNYIKKHLHIHL